MFHVTQIIIRNGNSCSYDAEFGYPSLWCDWKALDSKFEKHVWKEQN